MNQGIENEVVDNAEVAVNVDNMEMESDADSDRDIDESEDEFFEEIYEEIIEAINRNAEHLKLLQKSFANIKFELFDSKNIWYQRFCKEIEMANETIERVEEELYELSD